MTTAARAFVLAIACGQLLSSGDLDSAGLTLLALVLTAVVACAVDLDTRGPWQPWAPVVEAVLAATLIGTSEAPVAPLLMYLAVPPVIAGLRSGTVTALNTSFATSGAILGAHYGAQEMGVSYAHLTASVPWLGIGLGAGLLAARQTRETRTLEALQAPYAAAHRLVSQLHELSRSMPMGLDSPSVAAAALATAAERTEARGGAVLVATDDSLETLATQGSPAASSADLARRAIDYNRVERSSTGGALPLRVGEHAFGALVLTVPDGLPDDVSELQEELDNQAMRLDTAILFDDVRWLATSEERNRLAREIHDGVAQEIASLGYAIDDIAELSQDDATREAAGQLRQEVTRLVSELRLSIFDLRQTVDTSGGLSGALAEYVREVSARTRLRAHLVLDENGDPLPHRTQAELLRIAQEAVANVRKHAQAENLWVTLATEGNALSLTVADDGVGAAVPRAGHYGMHTMRERAESIGAELTVEARPGGGTIITVQSRAATEEEDRHGHNRAAG